MDISVIVPLYKGRRYIENILNMINRNWDKLKVKRDIEVIFVNDYPEEWVIWEDEQKQGKIPVRLICNNKNLGIHKSRIRGLSGAQGKYILFLDQDDEIMDDYLNTQLECIKDADAVLCNGWYRNGKLIYSDTLSLERAISKSVYFRELNNIVSPGQMLIKKEAIPDDWAKYPLVENGSDDVFLWILMFRDERKFTINAACKYIHNENGANTSLNFTNMKQSIEELFSVISTERLVNENDLKLIEEGSLKRIYKLEAYIRVLEYWDIILGRVCGIYERGDYENIAVYGFGVIGKKLILDLQSRGVKVEFVIDAGASAFRETEYKIYSLQEIPKVVDCIILTPLFAEDDIKKSLSLRISKIVSLKELC